MRQQQIIDTKSVFEQLVLKFEKVLKKCTYKNPYKGGSPDKFKTSREKLFFVLFNIKENPPYSEPTLRPCSRQARQSTCTDHGEVSVSTFERGLRRLKRREQFLTFFILRASLWGFWILTFT